MIVPPEDSSARGCLGSLERGARRQPRPVSEPGPFPAALEAQLLREKRTRYGQAVREQLAGRHRAAQASKEVTLQARLAATAACVTEQTQPTSAPPSRNSRSALPGSSKRDAARRQPQPAVVLQAILTVAQRLEDRLSALPTCSPLHQRTAKMAAARLASPSQTASDTPLSRPGSSEAGQSSLLVAGSPSVLSSTVTPSTSAAGSSEGSLPSAWGLHASRKLSKLMLHKQVTAGVQAKLAAVEREVALRGGEDPQQQANVHRLFASLAPDPGKQQTRQPALRKAAGTADGLAEQLQLEAEGDPFSIINIYLEEQWERQQQAHLRKTQVAAQQQPIRTSACTKPEQEPTGSEHVGQEERPRPASTARRTAPHVALPLATVEDRPISAATDQENVSQNVGLPRPGRPPALGQRVLQGPFAAALVASTRNGATEAPQLIDRTFQAEFERLMEMHEVELDLAQLQEAQLVGAAQKEISSLEAALDDQVARRLQAEASQAPDPVPQVQAGSGPVPGSTELAGQHLQLMSMLHFSQQQQLAHLQHLSRVQEQQQQQLLQLQRSQPPVPPPPALSVLAQRLPAEPGPLAYLEQVGAACTMQPVQQPVVPPPQQSPAAPAMPAMPPPQQPPAACAFRPPQQLSTVPAISPPQQLPAALAMPSPQQALAVASAEPAATEPLPVLRRAGSQQLPREEWGTERLPSYAAAPASKQQYVQHWLDGAGSEDQYSSDPDHVEESEPNSNNDTAVPAEERGAAWLGQQGAAGGKVITGEQHANSPPAVQGTGSSRDGSGELQLPAEAAKAWGSSRPEGKEVAQAPSVGALQEAETWPAKSLAGSPGSAALPVSTEEAAEQGWPGSAAATAPQVLTALEQAAFGAASPPAPTAAKAATVLPSPVPGPLLGPYLPQSSSSRQGVALEAMPNARLTKSSSLSHSEYSMSFEDADFEDAEFSYSEQHTMTTLMPLSAGVSMLQQGAVAQLPLPAAADDRPPVAEQPASPRLPRLLSPGSQASRPSSPPSLRLRPLSPHALDDKYPTPPRSPFHAGPLLAGPEAGPLESGDAAGSAVPGSRPGSPSASLRQASSAASSRPGSPLLPFSSTSTGPPLPGFAASVQAASSPAQLEAQVAAEQQRRQQQKAGGALEEPASPHVAPAAFSPPASPGSQVDDNTVVQSEGHTREYLCQVLDYFWAQRTQAYVRGEQPLDLEGFLHLECQRQPVGDPQHIFNKLLYDAANEALAQHYNKTLASFAGKVAPERALLERERVSQLVTSKVLGWAGMGCTSADLSRMLVEDAAEDEHTLALLTDMMQREINEGHYRAASPPSDG